MDGVGYCESEDVRTALQESSASFGEGPLGTDIVKDAIIGISQWFARDLNAHWYDAGSTLSDPVASSARTATDVRLDVPSSPHRQDRQLFREEMGVRYPTTRNGPYARIPLPHRHVQTLTKLEVRDRGGGVEDWVAASDKVEGRGEDYYVQARGQNSYGRTYLYVRGDSIGPRVDYGGLLTAEYDYGLDWSTTKWEDVRRGIAQLAAADVVSDDDVLSAIPDDGQLIGIDTQVQQLVDRAMRKLEPYMEAPVA